VPPGEDLWGLLRIITLNALRSEELFHRAARRDVRLCQHSHPVAQRATEDAALTEFIIEDALESLPLPQRQLVQWRIEGHEVADIASLSGRSKRTVERLLQDARHRLDELLQAK